MNKVTPLNRAKSIASLIESDADKAESEKQITRRVHDAFVDQGLIWIPLPKAYGGEDADIVTCIDVVEEISRADGATGWTYFVNVANLSGIFPFVSDEMLSLLYSKGHPPVLAGQLNPLGRSEEAPGGYVCSGRHSFASGSAFADWILSAQLQYDGEKLATKPDGSPKITIAVMPHAEIKFLGNWNVMGLAGTASYDYELPKQLVPSARMLSGDILSPDAKPLRGNAMLAMGALVHAYSLHTACAMGIAKRALQEIAKLTSTKSRPGYTGPVAEDPVFLNAFAQADAEFRSARSWFVSAFQEAEARVAAGGKLTAEDHVILRQVATWTHTKAGEVVSTCFRWGGTTPVRNPNILGRCMRDVLVTNAHLLFDAKTLTTAGSVLVNRWLA
jgi:alkylation response protein AidB-like acyl-CoA dehydrogenase